MKFLSKIVTIRVDQVIDNTGVVPPEGVQELSSALYANHNVKDLPIVVEVGEGKYEVIARSEDIAAARVRVEITIDVLIWDIPPKLIFAAMLFKNGRTMKLQQALPLVKVAMRYFSHKTKGDGAELRKIIDKEDRGLAEFVADLFGINRTDLYDLLEIFEKKPQLLKFINQDVTVRQAVKLLRRKTTGGDSEKKQNGSEEDTCDKPKKKRLLRIDEIDLTAKLTESERSLIRESLPRFLTQLAKGTKIPNEVLLERVYQHISSKTRKSETADLEAKVDHLSIAFEVDGCKILITIHEGDYTTSEAKSLQLPPLDLDNDDDSCEELAIAA